MKIILTTIVFLFLGFHSCYAQWQPDMRLTNDPAYSGTSQNNARSIASSGDSVYVIWTDDRNGIGNAEIYYKRSIDKGLTWSIDTRLTNSPSVSTGPSIAVSGSIVHVVWYDDRDGMDNREIYYKRSTDAGTTWGADTRLTTAPSISRTPSVTVSGSVVHVVWHDNRTSTANYEIFYKCSTDNGISWGTDIRLTNDSAESSYSSVAANGLIVHVVWQDSRGPAPWNIYYKRSSDGGLSWGPDMRFISVFSAMYPNILVIGQIVHLVWEDFSTGDEIFYKRSTDAGITWGSDLRLTNSSGESRGPSVAASGTALHIVWDDHRDGNWEIYYKRSTNGGLNWSSDTRLTINDSVSTYPSISVSGSVVHVVWEERRDGNYEIYCKRDSTGNLVGIINTNSEIPMEFSLSQNYPNPFNPITNIKFDITSNGNVKLSIFDVLGRKIVALVNQELKAGSYKADWDASIYPSGVYFYMLQAGDFVQSKKMMLIK